MIKYKYKKVKGYEVKKFTENGHTMFETDVLKRLERLTYLENEIIKDKENKNKIYAVTLCFHKDNGKGEINVGTIMSVLKAVSKEEAFGIVYNDEHNFKDHQLNHSNILEVIESEL